MRRDHHHYEGRYAIATSPNADRSAKLAEVKPSGYK